MASTFRQRVTNQMLKAIGTTAGRVEAKMPSAAEVKPGIWIGKSVDGARNVEFEGANVVSRGTSFQGRGIVIGRGSTIGIGCVFNAPVDVGRFTQFGSYVGVYGVDHPIDVAVPNVNNRFLGGQVGDLSTVATVTIGHGCWVGHGAVILRGVSIGNGAVIGAGSVVRRDVPAYSIVAGVPTGAPRARFDDDLAAALDAAAWWEWPDDLLLARRELFLTSLRDDPERARALLVGFPIRST